MATIGWDERGNPIDGDAVVGWDAEGKAIKRKDANTPRPTAASRSIPARQQDVVAPRKPENFAQAIGDFFSGAGQRREGDGEIITQTVPEERDQKFNGPLAPLANALPQSVRNWVGAEQRAAATGLGFFLNPNEESRAQIIKRQIPTAEFRRDEYGNLQARYAGDRPWAYINKPGASLEDLQTFANEIGKYLVVRRFTGGAPAAGVTRTPLVTSTAVEAARGGGQSAVQQALSMPLGAEKVELGDVAVSTAGSAVGNVLGHGVGTVAREAPVIARDLASAVSDRLPGATARLAERQAAATAAQDAAENLARMNAAATVRAAAENAKTIIDAAGRQINLQGEALETAIAEAQEAAVAAVRRQFAAPSKGQAADARELDTLARAFGIRLAKAQTEGDAAGMQFLYEAAGGMHGTGAQRQAAAFLSAQNQALPEAIRSIAGDISVTSPQAAVSAAREGLGRAQSAAKEQENAAWSAYDQAARKVRITQRGVQQVEAEMQQALADNKTFIDLPEIAAAYPRVQRVMALTARMASADEATVPLKDVDRVIQLKRFIDGEWEGADSPAERRLLSMLATRTREWLKNSSEGDFGKRAPVTAARLREALAISEQSAKTFRESQIMQQMLDERAPMTDQELTTRIFGGGEGGLNISSDSVRALAAMKEALGPSSPEWQALRQAGLQRLTRGLDDAIATNQTPAILTTFKRIEEGFRRNREAMQLLYTPDELARLREAQRIVAAMAPTARNPANPTNSGITAARAAKGILELTASATRRVPGASAVVGAVDDGISAARVNTEIAGAPGQGFNIVRRLADLWNVRNNGAGAPIGSAYATTANQDGTLPPR